MQINKKVMILGTEYAIETGNSESYPCLSSCDGYMDSSVHKIVIADCCESENDLDRKEDMESYQKQVCRHEIIHAFLYESGLSGCSNYTVSWAMNEEMVDWMSIQFPKIHRAFIEAGVYG